MKVENNQQMLGQWTKLIRMQHPEKMLKFVRSFQDETLATLYGIPDTETFLRLKNSLQRQTKEAAAQLLEDPAFADRVDQLPFRQGETIVGLGESTTDDLLSWFEILRQLLELRRPRDGIRLVNEGLSGHTSSQLLGRINGTMAHDPDWVLCMIGGNDALRFGPEPSSTQVSIGETSRNLAEIRRLAQARGNPRWVWITPSLSTTSGLKLSRPSGREESAAAMRISPLSATLCGISPIPSSIRKPNSGCRPTPYGWRRTDFIRRLPDIRSSQLCWYRSSREESRGRITHDKTA